jgi:putative membrane protein
MMHGYGYGWAWMLLMTLAWLGLIAMIVWAAIQLVQRAGQTRAPYETPREILDRRLALGEININAHEEALRRLAMKDPNFSQDR